MAISSITLMTFAATALLVVSLGMLVYEWLFRYQTLLRNRVKELTSDGAPDHGVRLFKDITRLRANNYARRTPEEYLEHLLDQASVGCSPRAFIVWCAAAGVLCGVVGLWLRGPIGLAAAPIGAATPLTIVYLRHRVRQHKICRQLPEAFQMVSRAVRAGQTVPAALKIIADDFAPPLCEEFALCCEQQNLGIGREAALRKLAQRSGVMELQIFVVALLVQARSGGDLVELLDNLAGTVRKRFKLKDRVRALTGEGRMQARVLLAMPIASLIGLFVLSPDYAAGVLQWPRLLAATACAQAVGVFWIRRIVNFKY